MSQAPKGTKPLSQRKAPGTGAFTFTPRNPLDVPASVKKLIEAEGKEYRWLDAKAMADRGNFHRNYWEIYRRDISKDQELGLVGLPADGTIRSGTCILGVRPKQVGDGHRELLKEKRVRLKDAIKGQGEEFRKQARKAGMVFNDETEVGEQTVTFESDDEE